MKESTDLNRNRKEHLRIKNLLENKKDSNMEIFPVEMENFRVQPNKFNLYNMMFTNI